MGVKPLLTMKAVSLMSNGWVIRRSADAMNVYFLKMNELN